MKKQIFTLLALLLTVCSGAWAQTYTDEASTVTWAFTSHSDLSSTNSPADAFLTTNFSAGSNLSTPTTFNTSGCKAGWAEQTLVYYKPIVEVVKNADDAAENMLEWTITPATGITFTPENVSITACTAGGTGDPQLTIYAVYSDDSKETIQSRTNPRRPDKTDQGDGPSVYTKALENAKNGAFKVRVYLAGLTPDEIGIECLITEQDAKGKDHISEVHQFEVVSFEDCVATYRTNLTPAKVGTYQFATRMFAKSPDMAHRQDFELVRWL